MEKRTNVNNTGRAISLKAIMIASLATVVLVMVVMVAVEVEGRYLPTRSDETRLESLKQLLRAMLDYNQEAEENPNNWPSGNGLAFGVHPNHVRSNYPKRSPELASNFMESDNNLRSLSYAETPQLKH